MTEEETLAFTDAYVGGLLQELEQFRITASIYGCAYLRLFEDGRCGVLSRLVPAQ